MRPSTPVCFICSAPPTHNAEQPGMILFACADHRHICAELMARSLAQKEPILRTIFQREAEMKAREDVLSKERHHPQCECPQCRPEQTRTIEQPKGVSH